MTNNWFTVHKPGLQQLLADRDNILGELVQNAWDAQAKNVEVIIELAPKLGRGLALLRVTDDGRGFSDLTHAFTLFAESNKKGDPELRGRYNFGEKAVLARCHSAEISSTSGTIKFLADGSRRPFKAARERGSCFKATIKMSAAEVKVAIAHMMQLLVPVGVKTTVNGTEIPHRKALLTFKATLPTEFADPEGNLRPTTRFTVVELYEPLEGEEPDICELGIPVVATGDRYRINVLQKVPLNMQRDNVKPSYLQLLRTLVLNETSALLRDEDAKAPWVSSALEDARVVPEAVQAVIKERHGERAVAFDPSDREANHRAVANGYQVIGGGTFSKPAWENIRAAAALPAAGKTFPTPKPYSDDPDAPPVEVVSPDLWTDGMRTVAVIATLLAEKLMDVDLTVRIVKAGKAFGACYGDSRLDFNIQALGHAFFYAYQENPEPVLDLLVHEFAHQYESNHLSDAYYKALSKLAAKLALLVYHKPDILGL